MLWFPHHFRPQERPVVFLEQRDFLTQAEVARLTALGREMPFIDGRLSNPHNITKMNQQGDVTDARHAEASRIVSEAFARSRPFQDFAMPKIVAPPLLARYEPGMKYGAHSDVAFMQVLRDGALTPLRSDISATVFLNDPRSYDGGELVLHLGTRPVPIKGAAGELFAYPSTLLHEVRPVTKGQRLVSITFIESLVPDERDRNALFELKDVWALEGLKMDWVNRVRMGVVLENLTRLWSRS
jgi:PKHD-type hydroxylase